MKKLIDKFYSWTDLISNSSIAVDIEILLEQVDILYENSVVYPTKENLFRVFKECPYDDVKVVILGQDPYHNTFKDIPSACGIAFATENGYINPSLRVMFKELSRSGNSVYGNPVVQGKKLIDWCNQGVLMLNTSLTVEEGKPESHVRVWKRFTESLITSLSREKRDLVWLLMGKHAQAFKENIISGDIINTPHPMVDVYGNKDIFVGSNVFLNINDILIKQQKAPIQWGNKPFNYE